MRRRLALFVPLAVVLVAVAATPAGADVFESTSSNWAGYAVSAADGATPLAYSNVSGAWKQPTATCTDGAQSYSAFWVGLGGLADGSQALEQVGTEANCSASGVATYSVWYELVPAAPVTIKLPIKAGDSIAASVAVSGRNVTVRITNVTQKKKTFAKTLTMSSVAPDVSSAEWVAEAPSSCSSFRCRVLPLADFDNVTFVVAKATANGHTGTIADPLWNASAISLASEVGQGRFGMVASPASALPSPLSSDGSQFAVTYAQQP